MSAVYTPAPGEVPGELGPNQFTAGSSLSLTCSVEGHSDSEDLSYSWSVSGNPNTPNCGSCGTPSSTTSTLIVGRPLYSYRAGNYTCTVNETSRPDSGSSDVFSVAIVGELNTLTTYCFLLMTVQVLEYILLYQAV